MSWSTRCEGSTLSVRELGLPPDQPTTLLWMYCAETAEEAEEGWTYFHNQLTAAQHHYFEWNNPGYEGIKGYEEYLTRQRADIGTADASFAARRATQPIGTPDEIIEKIRALQWTISLEKVVIHMFYGGMPREKAEKSLRLFADKVLPGSTGHAHSHQPHVSGITHRPVEIVRPPRDNRVLIPLTTRATAVT